MCIIDSAGADKKPYGGCKCGFATNWASRDKCHQCGAPAPAKHRVKAAAAAKAKAKAALVLVQPKTKQQSCKREAGNKIVKQRIKEEDIDEVSPDKIIKAMPSSSASAVPPVRYMGGVIYTVPKQHKFRALQIRGDAYSEKSAAWGARRSPKEVWKEVVAAIENHNQSKGRTAKKKAKS